MLDNFRLSIFIVSDKILRAGGDGGKGYLLHYKDSVGYEVSFTGPTSVTRLSHT